MDDLENIQDNYENVEGVAHRRFLSAISPFLAKARPWAPCHRKIWAVENP